MESNDFKYAIEALLFASERPLTTQQIKQAFPTAQSAQENTNDISIPEIHNALLELKAEYENAPRGFKLFEIAGGWQLVSDPRYSDTLKRFYQDREKRRLSQASLETLSVIAYRQPVTKADIEFVRGVNVDGALKTMLDRGLVKIVGRKEIPGRPFLYGTTKEFLEHFGLKSLEELPQLATFNEKDIEPHLLPPDMRPIDSAPATGEGGTGEQQPIGCDNVPTEDLPESRQEETAEDKHQ